MRRKIIFGITPKLEDYRKATITRLARKKSKKFQKIYYRTRIRYQTLLARLVKELNEFGIHASITAKFAPIVHEKSGHAELVQEGITAEENADWIGAKNLVETLRPKRVELELHLKEFLRTAKKKQIRISPYPTDINNCFDTITTIINYTNHYGRMPYTHT